MADSDLVYGIDVSPHQRTIDWARVAAAGTSFAWVKASEGNGWDSPALRDQVLRARAAGLDVGAYHYAREAISDPVKAAAHHCEHTADLPLTLTHVLDLEWDADESALTGKQHVDWALAWLREFQRITGSAPLVYTSPGYVGSVLGSDAARLKSWPLWVAAYLWEGADGAGARAGATFNAARAVRMHEVMGSARHPWPGAFVWQWTGSGTVDGVAGLVDRNVSTRGNMSALMLRVPDTLPDGWTTSNNVSEFVKTLF